MVIWFWLWNSDHFSTSFIVAIWWILEYLLAFFIRSHWPIFTTFGEMTNADDDFGNDPANIWIRIRVYLEMWIWNPDNFWLRLDTLVEVCQIKCQILRPCCRSWKNIKTRVRNYAVSIRHHRGVTSLQQHQVYPLVKVTSVLVAVAMPT